MSGDPIRHDRNQRKEDTMRTAKESARDTIDHLPDQTSWDDILHGLYVKRKIEEGLAGVEAGRTVSHERIRVSGQA